MCTVAAWAEDGEKGDKAKKVTDEIVKAVDASDKLADNVKAFVKQSLIPECTNAVFAKEVKAQNDKKVKLDDIKKIDKEWKEAEDELDIQKEKTTNACAKEVKVIAAKNPAIVEAFVMDNQGANVGQNALTSDYWQGDEAKWTNSYNAGKGGLEVGKVEFDKSANAQIQQVSLPIIDAEGTVIGAVTYGINVSKL
jgi:hypothetical protein